MEKEIVIARYNEDINWLLTYHESTGIPYKIYTPNEDIRGDNVIYIKDASGFEAYAYLFHITRNYNKLADITYFLQANPFNQIHGNLLTMIKYPPHKRFYPMGKVMFHTDHYDWEKEITKRMCSLCKLFKLKMLEIPFQFPIASLFFVRKENILQYPIETYLHALNFAKDTKNLWKDWGNGKSSYYSHAFERLWFWIFKLKEKEGAIDESSINNPNAG